MDDTGYRVAYAIAEDNLRMGTVVIADSVNPLLITRDAWMAVAARVQRAAIEIEVICFDEKEHRSRVESRRTDIGGLQLPTWDQVATRHYEPWTRDGSTASGSVGRAWTRRPDPVS